MLSLFGFFLYYLNKWEYYCFWYLQLYLPKYQQTHNRFIYLSIVELLLLLLTFFSCYSIVCFSYFSHIFIVYFFLCMQETELCIWDMDMVWNETLLCFYCFIFFVLFLYIIVAFIIFSFISFLYTVYYSFKNVIQTYFKDPKK